MLVWLLWGGALVLLGALGVLAAVNSSGRWRWAAAACDAGHHRWTVREASLVPEECPEGVQQFLTCTRCRASGARFVAFRSYPAGRVAA